MSDLMTLNEVAELTHVSPGTLRYWRAMGGTTGPRSFKLGPKKVMYRRGDVEAWIEEQYAATAEVG